MKNIVKITLFAFCCTCITGCSSQRTSVTQPTIIEETSTLYAETTISTSDLHTEEIETSKTHFSESGIEFDYPSNLNVKETRGEDGSKTEFTKDETLIFWYEKGENWRVNMDWDKDSYQEILTDHYPNALIDTFTKTTTSNSNIEMINVVFYPAGQNTDEKIEEYIFINQYAFYDFYFTNAENVFADEIMNSVNFVHN